MISARDFVEIIFVPMVAIISAFITILLLADHFLSEERSYSSNPRAAYYDLIKRACLDETACLEPEELCVSSDLFKLDVTALGDFLRQRQQSQGSSKQIVPLGCLAVSASGIKVPSFKVFSVGDVM